MGQEIVERGVEHRALLGIGGEAELVVIVDFHVEAARPFRHRPADAPHAEDAETLARDFEPQGVGGRPGAPALLAHHALAPIGAARRAQEQQHGEIGSGVGEDLGRVGDGKAALQRRRHLDMVIAHREGGDDAHALGQAGDGLGVELVGGRDENPVRSFSPRDDLVSPEHIVRRIEAGIEEVRNAFLDGTRKLAGDDDAGL